MKKTLLKRKLDIKDGEKGYEEAKAEFEELLRLFEKEKILSKIVGETNK